MAATKIKESASPSGEADARVQQIAEQIGNLSRSPIMHSPADHGLAYEDVSFPSQDGVPLEGWFIPAAGSTRLVIANHPMGFSRAGMPTHLEPWRSAWRPTGNDLEVNFVTDYKILHEAGYNVLAYDLRNHGHSGAANGAVNSSGIFEIPRRHRRVAVRPNPWRHQGP